MPLSLSHLERYHEEEYGFRAKLSLMMKHGVIILNRKASVRASSVNVRFHHLQRNQRPCRPILKHLLSLIRPILEYGFPIFCCSSDSILQKLERVELSAARIITGLRNSCPKDVLYEADLQPISLRRNACLVKYYSKLSGLDIRTSKFLRSWSSHQRLKRGSPFGHVASGHFVTSSMEHHSLSGAALAVLPPRTKMKNTAPLHNV
ncbi:RNase H domain-containing protein [Trichonephila clavipes]|nr:RNase H domain-containing protein [Trichonephila clavipes]